MPDTGFTFVCTGCGLEFSDPPVVIDQKNYCCLDCANGFSCSCGQAYEEGDEGAHHPGSNPPSEFTGTYPT